MLGINENFSYVSNNFENKAYYASYQVPYSVVSCKKILYLFHKYELSRSRAYQAFKMDISYDNFTAILPLYIIITVKIFSSFLKEDTKFIILKLSLCSAYSIFLHWHNFEM